MPYEIDFLPVGDGQRSGDAIALRFTHPTTDRWVHVIVDAGFADDGEALAEHVESRYGTRSIDLAILTHPDGDHIGGMGTVLRELDVAELWVHDIGSRGGSDLPAAEAVDDLMAVADEQGTQVLEPWAGMTAFGGALQVLGPDVSYYEDLVEQQLAAQPKAALQMSRALIEAAAQGVMDRARQMAHQVFGVEIPFDAGIVSPRNNTSAITVLEVDGRASLLTADAGEEAIHRALDHADRGTRPWNSYDLQFCQVPHHGSRRNCSSELLTRILGAPGTPTSRSAYVSCVSESEKHPAGRIVNAFKHRGFEVYATAGALRWHHHQTRERTGFYPATPLPWMPEEPDE